MNIAQRSNAQLVFDGDRPLGQYCLKLVSTQDLAENKEILIAYGAMDLVGERKPRVPKSTSVKRKRAEGEA